MRWVKVTRTNGEISYVNIERFDVVERIVDEEDNECTAIIMFSGEGESDSVNVRETPEEILSHE
jgi:hypothetical protein